MSQHAFCTVLDDHLSRMSPDHGSLLPLAHTELPSGWLKTDAQASEGQQNIIGFDPLRQTRSRAASRFPLYDYGRHASTAPSPSRLSVWSSIGSHSNVHFEERLASTKGGMERVLQRGPTSSRGHLMKEFYGQRGLYPPNMTNMRG